MEVAATEVSPAKIATVECLALNHHQIIVKMAVHHIIQETAVAVVTDRMVINAI